MQATYIYYNAQKEAAGASKGLPAPRLSDFQTSSVQRIVEEDFSDLAGTVVMQSNLMESDFLAAAYGYKMNRCVVTSVSRTKLSSACIVLETRLI